MPSKTAPPDLQHYQATIDTLAVTAAGQFTAHTAAFDWSSPDIQAIVTSVYGALVQSYRQASATVGLQMYRDLRDDAGIGGAPPRLLAADADPDWIATKVDNAFKVPVLNLDKLAAATAEDGDGIGPLSSDDLTAVEFTGVYDNPVQQVVTERLENSMQRMVASGSRETIVANVDADPTKPLGWARVPTADHPCGFCVVMASNLYRTKRSATKVVGRSRILDSEADDLLARGVGIKGDGVRKLGEKYHDHCSCIAVPVFKQMPPSAADYYEMYAKAAANAGTGDLKSILASMRQIYNVR